MSYLNRRARMLEQGAIRAMFDRASSMSGVISLGIGEPDMVTPEPICEAGISAINKGHTHYSENAGVSVLRQRISASPLAGGIPYDPKGEIIVTVGGMGALSLTMLTTLEQGDEILLPDPAWLNYKAQASFVGAIPVMVPTDPDNQFKMTAEAVARLVTPRTRVLLINTPANPTGAVYSQKELEALAEVAMRHNLLVISDEVYSTLVYAPAAHCSIASLPGMRERTVLINSFSKAFAMTGWRIGFAAGPAEIIEKLTRLQENINACASVPGQHAAAYALEHMDLAGALTQQFQKRRDAMVSALNKIDGISCAVPQGAFYAFADIRPLAMDSASFCNGLLEEERVVCIPGDSFGQGGKGFIRISYTTSEEQLLEAAERIGRFVRGR